MRLRLHVILAPNARERGWFRTQERARDHIGIWKDLAWELQSCLGSGLVGQLCLFGTLFFKEN